MTRIHRRFESWFAALTDLVFRHRYLAFLAMLIVTVALASQLDKLRIDTRDEGFFYEDDPALVAYNDFRDTFGQDDMFIIAMEPGQGLTLDFFTTLARLHAELEKEVPYVDEITSLVNGRIVRAEDDTLFVEELMEDFPQSEAELAGILALADRYPLYDRLLLSPDKNMAVILIKALAVKEVAEEDLLTGFEEPAGPEQGPRRYLSNEESVEIAAAINRVVDGYRSDGLEFYLAGTPAVVAELQKSIEMDLMRIMPLSFLLIVTFLFILFRRLSGVLFPLLTVTLSLVSSLGIMGMFDIPITNVIQILPSFLLVMGIGDSVHILAIFYRNHRMMGDKHRAIVAAVSYAGLPVLMTSVTTACGLLSFVWADVASVAQLGIVAPVGVMLAFLYTIILLPALIAIFPVKAKPPLPGGSLPLTDRIFAGIARFTTTRPLLICFLFGLICTAALWQATGVRFSHNALTWFPEDSPIRVATEKLDRTNGGTVMLEVLVDSGERDGLHDPDLLRRLEQAAEEIIPISVGRISAAKAWSIVDVLKEINRALNNGEEQAYRLPEGRELTAQELILFESSGSDDLEDFSDTTFRTGRLSILAPFADAILYKDYTDRVSASLAHLFPTEEITLTGHIPLFVQLIKNVVTSMAKSYIFALLVITLLMVVMIGRVRVGLLSMVANVVPILLILGLMGFKNIPLDLSTILVGSIVLGLVVDDTIHFLHHFRRAFEETGSVEESVRITLFTTGRALVITSLVLCSGFFIYTAAYLQSSIRYGLLTGSAVLFALAADFFLVPALLRLIYGRGPAADSAKEVP